MENSYVSSSWNPRLFEQPISAEKFFLTGERRQGVLVKKVLVDRFFLWICPLDRTRTPQEGPNNALGN